MQNNLFHTKDHQVYPGEFVPLPEVEALLDEIKISSNSPIDQLPVNFNEHHNCYKIEVIVPGAKREDIFIFVLENVLTIVVLNKHCEDFKKDGLQLHEFDTECMERHILLPENAEAEFASATYNQGILSLYLPKTNNPLKINTKQIVVY